MTRYYILLPTFTPPKTANSAGTPLLIDLAKFLLWEFLLSLEFSTTSNTHAARENLPRLVDSKMEGVPTNIPGRAT